MNSIPRLFGRRKAKNGERVDHVVEGRTRGEDNFTKQQVDNFTRGQVDNFPQTSSKSAVELPLSSSSSQQSRTYSEHSFNNENLYVNGQVPRGQFKEYFSVPTLEPKLEVEQTMEETRPPKPARSFLLGPDSSFFSRNVTTRRSALSMQPQPSSLPIPVFERAGSECGSLRRVRSVDDFVDSNRFEDTMNTVIGSPNTMGLPNGLIRREAEVDEEGEECAYYNVQFARKARSSSQLPDRHLLTRQSLRQHDSKQVAVDDSKYIQNLIKAQQRDPFGSSFLGHSLVTDKGEEGTNSMICDLDDNTLENTLIENQLDDTLVVNNVESPEAVKRSVPSNNKELQGNFLQSTMINTTNTTLSLANALQCNTISRINIIPLSNRSRKNILNHTNSTNNTNDNKVLQSTLKERNMDAESEDSGAGSLGPCSPLEQEQSAIGTSTTSQLHYFKAIGVLPITRELDHSQFLSHPHCKHIKQVSLRKGEGDVEAYDRILEKKEVVPKCKLQLTLISMSL